VKRLVLGVAALACAAAVVGVVPHAAGSKPVKRECGLPSSNPLWIDFGHGSVKFWKMFARPGLVSATANFLYPPKIRALGGSTAYLDLNFHRKMGSLGSPVASSEIPALANSLYDYAAASNRCLHPWIALNELFGAYLASPWSENVAQYRANVLDFVRILAERGAHPLLLINSIPYTAGAAGDWWREVAKVSDIVREVYFPAPWVYAQGPFAGGRTIRNLFRRAITDFTSIGVPASRLGLFLGFQTGLGKGGREGLVPAQAWFDTVKWQALAAKQVAKELGFSTIWSWGWAHRDGIKDELDKEAAACVYLWARDQSLCDGPKAAGKGFNASLTQGQLTFARGIRCTVTGKGIRRDDVKQLAKVTGDEEVAFTALFQRRATQPDGVTPADVQDTERALIAARFGGSEAAYAKALRRARASRAIARGVIADQLTRLQIEEHLRISQPTAGEISEYYDTYAEASARLVQSKPSVPWLGGTRGLALASSAPERVFKLVTHRWATIRTALGSYRVRALGPTAMLASFSLSEARASIRAALSASAQDAAYERWSVKQQAGALAQTVCRHDDLPAVDAVDLTAYLPFLALE
jgi:hypothetical protein